MRALYGQKAMIAVVMLLCLAAAALYAPSLSSGLYMDDYYNLRLLEAIPRDGYAAYVFSGLTGPSGRPLSLLTFALQHADWPSHIEHMKAVNLLLHLAVGLLVFAVIRSALAAGGVDRDAAARLAAGTAGLWLLHPMQASTVLYLIQRMAQLSALFMLLGAWGYLHGRSQCRGHPRRAYAWMTASVLLGTALAVLSKENGALLPLLILVMDVTLLAEAPAPPGYARWRLVFLAVPSALIALYLVKVAAFGATGFAGRGYTMYQKTLTEAAVLVNYLRDWVLPHPGAYGLFHDDFPISRGLLDPPATLLDVAAIVLAVAAAFRWRRRVPPLAFGVLWFFGGHLIESTHLDLAIYFEHRNYLPSIGVCLALAWACAEAARLYSHKWQIAAAAGLYAALLAWSGYATAALWRDPEMLAVEAVRLHPQSPSALTGLGNLFLDSGDTRNAQAVFRDMESQFPHEVYPPLKQAIVAACVSGETVPAPRWQTMQTLAEQSGPPAFEFLADLDTVIDEIGNGHCAAMNQEGLLRLMETLAENPAYRRQRGGLLQLAANLHMQRRELTQALADLRDAVRASPTPERQLQLLGLQLAMQRSGEAEQTLATLDRRFAAHPLARLAYRSRLQPYRERLERLRQIQ